MKVRVLLLLVLCLGSPSFAEERESGSALRHPVWEISPWLGAGTGLGKVSDFKFVNAGVRLGRVLTDEMGSGRFSGTLEWAVDLIPLYAVHQTEFFDSGPHHWVYAFSATPLVLKWNWTANERIVPSFAGEIGALISSKHIPPGDTSKFNFTLGAALGISVHLTPQRALDFSVHFIHISNGSLGNLNPGINTSLQFRIGFTWFK